MYMYGQFILLYSRNDHNIVKQLYSNKHWKKKQKKHSDKTEALE